MSEAVPRTCGETFGNMLGLDAKKGKTLLRSNGGDVQCAPITYELDGRQYLVIGSSGVLYAFSLPDARL
jgi:alcohol dehydrogenase (cytochrome c)